MNQPPNEHRRSSSITHLLETKTEWRLEYYLVLFFDLLGQRAQLRALTALPTDEEGVKHATSVLKATVGRVIKLRVAFESFFEGMASETTFAKDLAPPQRQLLHQHTQARVQYAGFSDSFLVFVPLYNTDEHCTPINGVHRAMLAACSIMTIALSQGIALRGGLDVGLGMELHEGEIYGPCLERAYYLESQKAVYPRIALGDELALYLSFVKQQTPTTTFGKCAVLLANQCSSLVFEDHDGTPALDYLGDEFRRASGYTLDRALVEKALEFAHSEVQRWNEIGETKLAERYKNLHSYLNSRLAQWNT